MAFSKDQKIYAVDINNYNKSTSNPQWNASYWPGGSGLTDQGGQRYRYKKYAKGRTTNYFPSSNGIYLNGSSGNSGWFHYWYNKGGWSNGANNDWYIDKWENGQWVTKWHEAHTDRKGEYITTHNIDWGAGWYRTACDCEKSSAKSDNGAGIFPFPCSCAPGEYLKLGAENPCSGGDVRRQNVKLTADVLNSGLVFTQR